MELTYKKSQMVDQEGNKLIIERIDHYIKLSLKLSTERKHRLIGAVYPVSKTLYVVRSRYKHLHVKSQCYGFNYEVLRTGLAFDKVVVSDEEGQFIIDKQAILVEGQFLFFKEQGFERQIFYPITKMHRL